MTFLAQTMEIPIGWVLTSLGALSGTIATLAMTVFKIMKNRLDAQDKVLALQDSHIDALKAEVLKLSQGCGVQSCVWRMQGGARPSAILPANYP